MTPQRLPVGIEAERRPQVVEQTRRRRSSRRESAPGSKMSVFAAPRRRTCREWRVARRAAASLWGMVTDRPRRPSAAAPATALAEELRRHFEGQVAPVEAHRGKGSVVQAWGERVPRRIAETRRGVVAAETAPVAPPATSG